MSPGRVMPVASCVLLLALFVLAKPAAAIPDQGPVTTTEELHRPLTSGEILEVMRMINRGELEQAKLALERSANPQVRQVARLILEDHFESNRRLSELVRTGGITLEETPLSRALKVRSQIQWSELASLAGEQFDRAYLEQRAEGHKLVMNTVEERLLPSADDRRVRDFLEQFAPRFAQHRQEALDSHAALR